MQKTKTTAIKEPKGKEPGQKKPTAKPPIRPQIKPFQAVINLNPGQKKAILKHYKTTSLSEACALSLKETTGVMIPGRLNKGKKELLVFALEAGQQPKPLFAGQAVDRRTVQDLLGITRAAVHLAVKKINESGMYIFQNKYLLKLEA